MFQIYSQVNIFQWIREYVRACIYARISLQYSRNFFATKLRHIFEIDRSRALSIYRYIDIDDLTVLARDSCALTAAWVHMHGSRVRMPSCMFIYSCVCFNNCAVCRCRCMLLLHGVVCRCCASAGCSYAAARGALRGSSSLSLPGGSYIENACMHACIYRCMHVFVNFNCAACACILLSFSLPLL